MSRFGGVSKNLDHAHGDINNHRLGKVFFRVDLLLLRC
jgi:hypothetical protein